MTDPIRKMPQSALSRIIKVALGIGFCVGVGAAYLSVVVARLVL